ncbi:uncharacterized protein LOC121770502 [Salvia splendens]|uniref:uncharacterized protein LOC121770502 n=1 Tax=Salvia splendens TaxID=180675 RepID=UPI001C263CE9|nr:uncharacterized protein LOC121770502 [Salvia splendens]
MSLNPLSVILKENKLEGPNYVDWKRNLDIVLIADDYKFVLDTDCPAKPTDNASEEEKAVYKKCMKGNEMAKCYILASMSNVLQHQHHSYQFAYEIMENLQSLFGTQSRSARSFAIRSLMNKTMKEDTPVRDHVLEMIRHLNQIEVLGGSIDVDSQVDIILHSLPASFQQFKVNYEITKQDLNLAELLTELQNAESIYAQAKQAILVDRASGFKVTRPRKDGKAEQVTKGLKAKMGKKN